MADNHLGKEPMATNLLISKETDNQQLSWYRFDGHQPSSPGTW
jgi:hypothetical protein